MHYRYVDDRGAIGGKAGLDLTLKLVELFDQDAAATETLGDEIQTGRPQVAVEGVAVALALAGD